MAEAEFDFTGWIAGLDKLSGGVRKSLARSMGVAGGKVLRDEAKRQCPTGEESGSITPGLLKSSIYLAFKDARSNDLSVTYAVSWNAKKAPHGHLVEFGHWQPYKVVRLPNGDWFTDLTQPDPSPKFTPANPFLRPAFDIGLAPAREAMIRRGRERLPELLSGEGNESGS